LTPPPHILEDADLVTVGSTGKALRTTHTNDAKMFEVFLIKHFFRKPVEVNTI
jgi:hypothetical protein